VIWSPQQQRALSAVAAWLRDPDGQQVFRLFGYAGTGKTTLVKHIAEGVVGKVLFAAFTGKAAHVMRERGCPDASTIHHLIYRFISEQDGRPHFVLDPTSKLHSAQLLILDEASMVDEVIGRDLLSFGTPILVVGDPGQLPPVNGSGFLTADNPDVMLTEIHRQALDNPIIRMSMTVRTGGRLEPGNYGNSRVITGGDIDYRAADQVLVGRNVTRRASNNVQRTERGMSGPYPLVGDKLVCLRNDHGRGLLNGSTWRVDQMERCCEDISLVLRPENGGSAIAATTHIKCFDGNKLERWQQLEYDEFDFGYALTVHKAQGSQWDNVVLIDESRCFGEDQARWLYTGITRTRERVTVVTRR
jgi:exodeoxyribonuclease-5